MITEFYIIMFFLIIADIIFTAKRIPIIGVPIGLIGFIAIIILGVPTINFDIIVEIILIFMSLIVIASNILEVIK